MIRPLPRLTPEQQSTYENERAELNVAAETVVLEVTLAKPESDQEAQELARLAWEAQLPGFSPEFREAFQALSAVFQ